LNITEDILRQTEQELLVGLGLLSEETSLFWWNQNFPPPEDEEKFADIAEKIRASHRDTLALYEVIKETHKLGFESELLVFWDGNEDKPAIEIRKVCLDSEPIDVDFLSVHENVDRMIALYRFV
jgi:hypothetical protein